MNQKGPLRLRWMHLFGAITIITVAMMFLSFPAGLYTAYATHLSSNDTVSTGVVALNLDVLFAIIPIPVKSTLGDLFTGSLVVFFAFLVLAMRQGSGFLGAIRSSLSTGYSALFSNPLCATTILVGATSLLTVLIDDIQSSAGVSTGSLSGDPFALMVDFTIAPLLEETSFRVIMIGVPVLLLSAILLRDVSPRKVLKVLWRPSSLWDSDETVEGDLKRTFKDSGPWLFPPGQDSLKTRAVRPIVYVFLFLSSISFGYAHYAAGSGWGPGKISEAAVAGLALGYLYVKYGFHTDVLLHWSINYVGSIFSFLAQGLWGIPYTSNSSNFLDVFPSIELVLILGIPSTVVIAKALLDSRTKKQALEYA